MHLVLLPMEPLPYLEPAQVSLSSVKLGLRVARGKDWRTGKWRSDVKCGQRCAGTVVGYTDSKGRLVGANTTGEYYDRFYIDAGGEPTVGPGWAAVEWDNGNQSIYPIGSTAFLGDWWARKCANKSSKAEVLELDREVARGKECFALMSIEN